jgi:integrase
MAHHEQVNEGTEESRCNRDRMAACLGVVFTKTGERGIAGLLVSLVNKPPNRVFSFLSSLTFSFLKKVAERGGFEPPAQVRGVLNDMFKDVYRHDLQAETVERAFESFIESKRHEVSESTCKTYSTTKDDFLESIGEEKRSSPLMIITQRDIENFKTGKLKQGLAPSTVNGALKVLKMVFSKAVLNGEISIDPSANVERVKVRSDRVGKQPFTIAQLEKVYDVADHTWRGIILFGFYTGQRLGDVCKLRWDQIDLDYGQLSMRTRKTGGRVIIPLAGPVIEYLSKIPAAKRTEYVFPDQYRLLENTGRSAAISNQFSDILARAGLGQKRGHRKTGGSKRGPKKVNELSFHSLRHTTTSLLKQNGASQAVAMSIIGHESEAVNDHYTHIDHDTMQRYIAQLPLLG